MGIGVLIDMSLISISGSNSLGMHDLLQEMGREIVREQCLEEPGRRNRLWVAEDICHVLKNRTVRVKCSNFLRKSRKQSFLIKKFCLYKYCYG